MNSSSSDSPGVQSGWSRFAKSHYRLLLLIVVHIPLTWDYYRSLWLREHYQFFPFAIIAFLALFRSRRSSEPERWGWGSRLLVAADIVCLGAAFFLNSPWLATVGLVMTLSAWCLACRDVGYERSLFYLSSLLLITLRLPFGDSDERVIHWLQRWTTSGASAALHQTGFLHYREGNILNVPGRQFLVAEACSGVQSLFTTAFLACLILCLKRRSLVHGMTLILSSLIVAAVMNILRIMAIVIVWHRYGADLSTGWQHDLIGYCGLILAAVLMMSADSLFAVFTAAVPDVRRPGISNICLNPLIYLWNRWIAVIPVTRSSWPRRSSSSTESSTEDDATRRELPAREDILRPANWFAFLFGWLESWLLSRSYRASIQGVPFLMASAVTIISSWMIRHAATDRIVERYEALYDAAAGADMKSAQEICLKALASLRPFDHRYRFRVAQHLIRQQRFPEAGMELAVLAPERGEGYPEARLWLARQALRPQPLFPMTADAIESNLNAILQKNASHEEARSLLVSLCTNRGEWKLAEHHLTRLAVSFPSYYLQLAKLRRQLGRSSAEVEDTARQSLDSLSEKLQSDRQNISARLVLSEALALSGKADEARELLIAGLQNQDDPLLMRALSRLDVLKIETRLAENLLHRDSCIPLLQTALKSDPASLPASQMLLTLQELGAEIPREVFDLPIGHWRQIIQNSEDSDNAEQTDAVRLLLCRLLASAGDYSEAVAVLRDVQSDRPGFRLMLADLLRRNGAIIESDELFTNLIDEARQEALSATESTSLVWRLAEVLLASGRAEEAYSTLLPLKSEFLSDSAATGERETRTGEWALPALVYGRACLAIFDRSTGFRTTTREFDRPVPDGELGTDAEVTAARLPDSVETPVDLLIEALRITRLTNAAIDRLTALSLSERPDARQAHDVIRRIRLEGTHGAQVLNLMGMQALLRERYDQATEYLERANQLTRGTDAMILNNLAIAIVRGQSGSPERALQYANQTLLVVPDHPDALSTRGEIFVAMNRWSDALADLTESLKLRQTSPEVHRLLAAAYRGVNDDEMANEHFQRAELLENNNVKP